MTGAPHGLGRPRRVLGRAARLDVLRPAALVGVLGLIGSYLGVLLDVVRVTGDPRLLLAVAAASLVAATVFARFVRPRHAVIVGLLALSAGLGVYFYVLGFRPEAGPIVGSLLQLTTGGSALQIRQTTLWALAVTPAPVFLTWYLALRRRYGPAVVVGAAALSFFVLTDDATTTLTLLGVAGGAAALGFGDLDRETGAVDSAGYVLVALAIMVLAPLLITVVPGGAASPLALSDGTGGGSAGDLEASVVGVEDRMDIVGSISLSPEVRFTVEADRGGYWRTGSYARYTGEGWVRVGDDDAYDGDVLQPPQGPSYRLDQTIRAEDRLETIPVAWRPVALEGDWIERVDVERGEQPVPRRSVEAGQTYRIVSAVPDPSAERLQRAGTDYPGAVESLYTQLPSDTSDRLAEGTERVVDEAETPFEKAVAIERYLRSEKDYSLDVDRPEGDVAETFLYEMDAGYCTYFATTMATMLRSEGVPARVAVGYSTGQQVDGDRWVVRGSNAHAWVEVYFPDVGWVEFDPTPRGSRLTTAQSSLEEAREDGAEGVDTAESADVPPSGTISDIAQSASPGLDPGMDPEIGPSVGDGNATPANLSGSEGPGDDGSGGGLHLPALPSTEHLALGTVVALGAVAGLSRSRYARRVGKRLRVRYQRRTDPATDVERAFARLGVLLELRHRPRRTGETVREYLAAIEPDPRAHRVARIRERARYGGEISPELADEAVDLVDAVRAEDGTEPAA